MYKLEELYVYTLAMEIGEEIWLHVEEWDTYYKWGLGKQLTGAADSIAANIAEGYGRYYYKENRVFCYYSRGSAFETIVFLEKAKARKLIPDDKCILLIEKLTLFLKLHNNYIKSIGRYTVSHDQ